MRKEINFDLFVRGLIVVGALVVGYFLLAELSSVLIPFFVAWAVAYMLHPFVNFLQTKCRLRNRALSVVIAVCVFFAVVGGLLSLSVPSFVAEGVHLKNVALSYIQHGANNTTIPRPVQDFIQEHASQLRLDQLLEQKDFKDAIREVVPTLWDFATSTAGTLISLLSSLIAVLYLFLLLLDWETYAKGWIDYIPRSRRPFVSKLMGDIETNMAGYFRGQALVALSNCVMFSIGFLIIDFPMPIGLGVFIGLISFVPYVQVLGIIPAAILALLKAAETGSNFWLLIGGVLLVYIVVQVIQDVLVTPKIMGHIMGLRPAIILLSLSVWGYLLGIIGLIIALPVTTLVLAYYKEYVVEVEEREEAMEAGAAPPTD